GLDNFNSGFLPATYQGSVFQPHGEAVANARPLEGNAALQQSKLALMKALDSKTLERTGPVDALESAIANYELAYAMQVAVPDLMDISQETEATQKLYGIDAKY